MLQRQDYDEIMESVSEHLKKRLDDDPTYLPDAKLVRLLRDTFPPISVDPEAVKTYIRTQQRWMIDIFAFVLQEELDQQTTDRLMTRLYDIILPPERRAILQAGDVKLMTEGEDNGQ
jgi:hypothetical protein